MPRRKTRQVKRVVKATTRSVNTPTKFRFGRQKTWIEKFADKLSGFFGSLAFLGLNVTFFVGWVAWNLGAHPELSIFDPYPFGMLTMIVSLEAIVLSVVVLISQNRSNKIAETREEIDFEVNVASERQIAEMMRTLDTIMHHLKVTHVDKIGALDELDVDKLSRRVIHDIDTD
ncbi:MAG: DUF1003 domain-containing protein [Patescibacteria group bacterium]